MGIPKTIQVGYWLSWPSDHWGLFFNTILTCCSPCFLHVTLLLLGRTSRQAALAEACAEVGIEIKNSDLVGM